MRPLTRTLPPIFVLTLIFLATTASAELPASCDTPWTFHSNDSLRHPGGLADEAHCYRLDLPSPGLLNLSALAAGWLPSGVRLGVFGEDGEPARFETVQRSAGERLVLAPAGTWYLEIAGEDPELPLPSYRLGSRFVDLAKSETDGEIEIEPEELRSGCAATKSETDGEIEIEPEELRASCGPVLLDLLCHGTADDHADTFACATPFHRRIAGEIGNGWGDDIDVFRFRLRRWRTVEIVADGAVDTFVTLYDGAGQRLDRSAADGDSRLVRTLRPGAYFVGVEAEGSAGAYSLSIRRLGD